MDTNAIAALALIVSIFSFVVSSLRLWEAREKLRLDLATKRYDVFDATQTFIAAAICAITEGESLKQKTVLDFREAQEKAFFLFNDDSVLNKFFAQLEEASRNANSLSTKSRAFEQSNLRPEHPQRIKLAEELQHEYQWLLAQVAESKKLFSKYLSFRYY